MSESIPLGPGVEFDAIRAVLARWGALAEGVGDDAAVLAVPAGERLVVSTDTSIEGVHFRRDWITPREIAARAVHAALSDLAAMAATPIGLVLSLTLPPSWRSELMQLADGVADATAAAGTRIVGGDLTSGEQLAFTVTVLGSAVAPIGRGGARVGDTLWVTGALGGPRLALAAFERGLTPLPAVRARFAAPTPRIAEAAWLAAHGATAMIDISDGVVSEAAHLAAAGHVGITLHLDRLPCVPTASMHDAAMSGEEYELLLTAPASLDAAAFAARFGLALTAIGEVGAVEAGAPAVRTLVRGSAVEVPRGHDHLSA